ncbi:hypothetical protein ACNAW0_22530 [Micromonospora sp. SL1-18]|uniref:hypothetical protein n=1 Tax=Micromonospora sp. SL1-18 TaxID=3399128 RepID=UPI003A4D6435
MVSIVRMADRTRRWSSEHASGVTITRVTEVPAGASVNLLKLDPDGYVRYVENTDHEALCVLSGSGWVEGQGMDRTPIAEGTTVFVGPEDDITVRTDDGLVLLSVFGGWMYPE